MKTKHKLFLTTVFLFFFSCKADKPAPEIEKYLIEALDTIEKNALNSNQVDWDQTRKETMIKALGAKSTEDTYDILVDVLEKLEDHHSFLQKNSENLSYPTSKHTGEPYPYQKRPRVKSGIHKVGSDKIARLYVPSGMYSGNNPQILHDILASMASENPVGWIVDLRGNGGGNVWGMLAATGVLTGENPLGGSVFGNGSRDYYRYENGASIYVAPDGEVKEIIKIEEKTKPGLSDLPLAFLTDRGTGSSGEAMAVIFKVRNLTRGFGEKTFGASTSTQGFLLSDSLNLVLATSTFQDRQGNTYADGVMPDVKLSSNDEFPDPYKDPVIEAAISWILENKK